MGEQALLTSTFHFPYHTQSIENDMGEQVRRFDALNECGQQIVSVVDNQEAIARISALLEEFQERWERLVQDMESQSKEVRLHS